MADFRKMLYAFALVALLVGISAPASAQQMSCSYGSVFPSIRAEAFTDLVGDITIDCTGGTRTAATESVPRVNIYVFLTNGIITSKIMSTGVTPAYNEALLLVDDPNRANVNNFQDIFTHPIRACDNVAEAWINANPGSCNITAGAGAAATTYDGTAGHPNVFQGRQVPGSNNAVSFLGVPIDPPGPGVHRYFRVTNIRVNAVAITGGVASGNFGTQTIQASVTTDPSTTIPGNQFPLNVGVIQQGLVNVRGTVVGPYPQCNAAEYTNGGHVYLDEGFASAFKVRNWRLMQDNGTFGGGFWDYNEIGGTVVTGADLNQNVPGTVFNTESGFVFYDIPSATTVPQPDNPPNGLNSTPGTTGFLGTQFQGLMTNVGRSTQGTRFMIRFANVPVGSGASVPVRVFLYNSSGNVTGALIAVTGYDAAGAGGALTTTGSILIGEGAGPFTVEYEVIFADYTAVEYADIPVTLSPTVNLGANPPVNGSPQIGVIAQATAGFAPFYPGTSNAGSALLGGSVLTASAGPIPRYAERFLPTPPVNLWSYNKCACDLLFPWVVGDGTFTTSIVIANTSRDPGSLFSFTASAQTGRVRFWYYGTAGIDVTGNAANPAISSPAAGFYPSQQSTILTPAGSYLAHIISPSAAGDTTTNGLAKQPGNFAGYVIAQSEFRYCHGVAAISSALPGFGTQTYVGLVMDNGYTKLPARTSNAGENFEH